jgi:hypothetical protein
LLQRRNYSKNYSFSGQYFSKGGYIDITADEFTEKNSNNLKKIYQTYFTQGGCRSKIQTIQKH